jgi:hypothetical protein
MKNKEEIFHEEKFTIDELFRKSLRFRSTKDFNRFFNFISRFHHYSRYNTMLVYIQNEAVTFFGGKAFWEKRFNRTIKENARPYIILSPGSPIMLVYDVFDTDGEESPNDFLIRGLGTKPFEVMGKIENRVFEHALNEARKWGIKISFKPLSYFNAGYVTTILKGYLEICLKEGMTQEENFSVLIHELSHLFLGHTGHKKIQYYGKEKPFNLPVRKLPSRTEELEAETISYLICKKIGLESRSSEYLAGFIQNQDDLSNFSYELVIKVADKIEKLFIR